VRIAVVYDCLYPYTVGGGERWYRALAEAFAADGHKVVYLTRREWPEGEAPDLARVRVVAVAPGGPLYTATGRRRIGPPLRFGFAVLRHLLRHRGDYDAVHACAFPFFSLLAARAALARTRTVMAVDWFEVWTLDYWREYLGAAGGRIGHAVQRACVRATPLAFVFSDLHARRLRSEGLRRPAVKLDGLYAPPPHPPAPRTGPADPVLAFAGRLIPEKRAHLIPAVVATARRRRPGVRAVIIGDGPERDRVREAVAADGVQGAVALPGFVSTAEVAETLAEASCHLLPSAREGYGLVVIEAAAWGTPSVVVHSPDNAAVELVEEGVNGAVAASAEPGDIADAVLRVLDGGAELRERTAAWFAERAERLTVSGSVRTILAHYAAAKPNVRG
jgi:glycosyltransferase involved in cell wall biosynthesis